MTKSDEQATPDGLRHHRDRRMRASCCMRSRRALGPSPGAGLRAGRRPGIPGERSCRGWRNGSASSPSTCRASARATQRRAATTPARSHCTWIGCSTPSPRAIAGSSRTTSAPGSATPTRHAGPGGSEHCLDRRRDPRAHARGILSVHARDGDEDLALRLQLRPRTPPAADRRPRTGLPRLALPHEIRRLGRGLRRGRRLRPTPGPTPPRADGQPGWRITGRSST